MKVTTTKNITTDAEDFVLWIEEVPCGETDSEGQGWIFPGTYGFLQFTCYLSHRVMRCTLDMLDCLKYKNTCPYPARRSPYFCFKIV